MWARERTIAERADTNHEIRNIFELAIERRLTAVGIVTVGVHYARALLMAREHHLTNPLVKHLELQMYTSEEVLLKKDPAHWEKRIRVLHGSKAFTRTSAREEHGINCFLVGTY